MSTESHCELCVADMISAVTKLVTITFCSVCLLGACQPLPRPFQPLVKAVDSTPPNLEIKLGLFLAGIDNAPTGFEANFLQQLSEELTLEGIVSSEAVANQGSYLLVGSFSTEIVDSIHLSWEIVAADGVVIGLFEQVGEVEEIFSAKLAEDAAKRISSLMKTVEPSSARDRILSVPTVALSPVDGAPGDGRISLTSAMRAALGRRSIRVLAHSEEGALLVLGSVHISSRDDGQLVEVHWSVINEKGQELGSVTQSNVVPVGTLDGSWGDLAHAVADGGADGVVALLREAHRWRPALKSD